MENKDFLTPDYSDVIGKKVCVKIDRPLGSRHPEHSDIVYQVNYGFIEDVIAGDGEEQDAYVLGIDVPVQWFEGIVIAVYHRINDCEDKWIVSPCGADYSDGEILSKISFQELFFTGFLCRK